MNRTTSIVINHSIAKEFKEGLNGKPYAGREELSFAGRTIAAKWALKNKKKLQRASDFYFKFWNDNPINDADYIIHFYWGGSKFSLEDVIGEIKKFAENKDECEADMAYIESAFSKQN